MSDEKLTKMPVNRMILHPSFGSIFAKGKAPETIRGLEAKMMYTWYEVVSGIQTYGVYITVTVPADNQSFAVRSYPIYLN